MKHLLQNSRCSRFSNALARRHKRENGNRCCFKLLRKCNNYDHVIIWADNCSGQNKNWWLFTILVQFVNTWWGTQSVSLKYLEKGHTFMAADGIHGEIGKQLKKDKNIVNFDDFVKVCRKGSKTCKTIEIDISDFYLFPRGNKCRSSKVDTMPLLEEVVGVKFIKGSTAMMTKTSFLDESKTVHFLNKKFLNSGALKTFPTPLDRCKGIPSNKKEGIIRVLKGISEEKRRFWNDLCVDDGVVDLVNCRENKEVDY